jgi:microcystin-dependent protein
MAYQVRFTDSVNKGSITVEDFTINTDTDLSFVGARSTGYGLSVAENFLHLLENFANTTPPDRPVEGQLWYDNSEGVNQLKIYDGTTWAPSGGLKKSTNQPAVSNSIAGDLWVNTDTQQLYLFTGSAWVLVGPDFSDGLLTGGQAEVLIGTDNANYPVFIIKIQDRPAIIISAEEFTPKTAITGFRTGIKPGINLSDTPLVPGNILKYYGTSQKAESLIVGNETISASNFLRGNAVSTTQFQIKVKSNEGIQYGEGGQLSIYIDNEAGVIQHNNSGSNIDIRMGNRSVIRVDGTRKVGINNTTPDEDLDVIGNIQISPNPADSTTGVLKVESTINSTDIDEGSIVTKGGVGIALNLSVGGNVVIDGTTTTTNIIPDSSGTRDIGTISNKYDTVYATNFIGNLQGNVTGTITGRAGSADRLTSATTFAISGDVDNNSFAFDGQTGGSTKTFDVRISNSFISSKDAVSDANNSDEILLNRVTGTTGVYRITKRNFLKTIPLVPAGVIVPYGGISPPTGWLICDGSEVLKSDYTELWLAIQHNFKPAEDVSDGGVNYFTLPDFRGRFPLGIDDMGFRGSAGVVNNINAQTIGQVEGSESKTIQLRNLPEHEHDLEDADGLQYYGIRLGSGAPSDPAAIPLTIEPGLGGTQGLASSGGVRLTGTTTSLGNAMDVMNPYLTVTYIIYTGQ